MDPILPRRLSVQLILAALAFLTGVIILVVRFGGSSPAPDALVSTPPTTVAPAGRATELMPVAASTATPSPTAASAMPTSATLATVSPEAVFPAATLPPSPVTVLPTVALLPSPVTVLPTVALPPSPVAVAPTVTPMIAASPSSTPLPATPPPTASPTPVVSPIPTATATTGTTPVVPTTTAGSPIATLTATASPTRSTPTVTPTPDPDAPTPLPTATSTPTMRRLTLLVEGTSPQAEISYEIDDTEQVVGSDVVLPWQQSIEVASDLDVRLMAAGVAEFGDLRCRITGDSVPTPVTAYDSNPYPSVECILRGS
ncbi:MAG: hypothetical protein ACUVWS_07250 [Roseiflexus sp.]